MKSSLQTLSRIQKFNIDEQRKLLVEQQEKEERLINEINKLTAQFEQEKEFARNHANYGDFGLYAKRYIAKRDDLETSLAAVQARIEEIRDTISAMFKEQKTFEIVDKNRKKAEQKELRDKEQKMLDEIGTNAYIKHQRNDKGD